MISNLQMCINMTYWSTHVNLQETPIMEYAKVDKSKKKISQDSQKPTAEYDDTVVEDEAAKVSVSKNVH